MHCQIRSEQLSVTIHAAGAEASSITDAGGREYLWQADKEIWPRHAPVLFPIVGRLQQNKFIYKDTTYELGQHGFARDQLFHVAEQGVNHCVFELDASPETRRYYPFDFKLRITYTVKGPTLTTAYQVINPSAEPLVFNLGAHPGFNCPLTPGEAFEDYYLEFDRAPLYYTALDNGLRTDEKHPLALKDGRLYLTGQLFDHDALVFENSQVNQVRLRSSNSSYSLTMNCKDWPYFGIWAKKGCRRFVCLEPWYGVADRATGGGQLTGKEGIITLDAGKDFQCSFSITLG